MTVSLRTRIVALGVGTAMLVIALAAVPLALLLRSSASSGAQQQATLAAQSAANFVANPEVSASSWKAYLDRLNNHVDYPVSVILPTGQSLGATVPASTIAALGPEASPDPGEQASAESRVSDADIVQVPGGYLVLIFVRAGDESAHTVRVISQVSDSSVSSTLHRRLLTAAGIGAILLTVAWVTSEIIGRRLTRPLVATSRTALRIGEGDLQARAPVEGPPEVAQVAIELNALAERIDELLSSEREAAADMSHRLRTPLTAVRLLVDALPASPDRDELVEHVGQLERTLTQVIGAARRGSAQGIYPHCDAVAVLRERASFWEPLAEDQGRTVEVLVPSSPTWVRATADDLTAALDVLIENVFAHTEDGTGLRLTVATEPSHVFIDVLDRGPGIDSGALPRGRSDGGSTGLGLDIARAIAESAGGGLELKAPQQGYGGVRLRLAAVGPDGHAVHGSSSTPPTQEIHSVL